MWSVTHWALLPLSTQHKLGVLKGLLYSSQSSSARCAGVLPYSSSTAMQSMARVVPSSNRASTRLVSILKRQESSLFMVNLISISNGVCSDVLNPAIKPVVDLSIGLCFARLHIFAHFLHT